MTPPAVAARGLAAGYNGVPVVQGIDIEVYRGEMVLLAGANGAGKTTTLMALAGALQPIEGHVEAEGAKTRKKVHERARNGLGLILEQRTVINKLTTLENLRLGQGSVEDALGYFPELSRRLKVKAGLLSGGEQQMLSLARVLAAGPTSVIVDELSFGLAPIVVSRLLKALRDVANSGAAVLLVEQHVLACLPVVDRVYFMQRGSIADSGPAPRYADMPRDELAHLYL